MLTNSRTWLHAFAACVLLGALVSPSVAQPSGYTKLDVKGRVQLEVPDSWTINDADHRKRVSEWAEKTTGVKSTYVAALSVQSYPAPSRFFARVSFVKTEPPYTQEELRKEVRENRRQVESELAESWNAEAPAMWAALAPKGAKEVGRPSFAAEPLGSQIALVIRYARTTPNNQAETMRVAQYHIPLGAEKAIITLSYIDGDAQAQEAHARLKKSIVIR